MVKKRTKKALESDLETEAEPSSKKRRQSKAQPPQARTVKITLVDPPLSPEEIAWREARIASILREVALRLQQEKESSKNSQLNMNSPMQTNEKEQSATRPPSKKNSAKKNSKPQVQPAQDEIAILPKELELMAEFRELIGSARMRAASALNSEQTLLYWQLGRRIVTEQLTDGRGAYGKEVLKKLSSQLVNEFGNGFSYSALTRMARFAELFPDKQIVVTLLQHLGWGHILALLPIKDALAREFYAEMCRIERWPVRILRKKINGMLFERTALSKNTAAVVQAELAGLRAGKMTPALVFRDPYLLDFLGLEGAYSEQDLEMAILRELEGFLLELGSGFTFVARQKRMAVGKDDFRLDLLFFHRYLRRLVAIELKLESFQPAHVGQMELYLRWLDKYEKAPGEESPIGLILCASADAEQIELLQLDEKSIRVAEYLTELPPIGLLQTRLHQAIEMAKEAAALRQEQKERDSGEP